MNKGKHVKLIDIQSLVDVQEVIDLLKRLIEIPGHEEYPGQERDRGMFLYNFFKNEGIDVELQDVCNERYNVIAKIPGNGTGKSIMLNGHIDTIPPYDMPNALVPKQVDGKIYGRGAVDMLGAVASMVYTLVYIKRAGVQLSGDVFFTGVVGEEHGSPGTWHLVNSGITADYGIVGEPTMMEAAVAHKGIEWLDVHFKGKSTHGSVPEKGINAIQHASQFIQMVMNELIPTLNNRKHSILGRSTINIGQISGGARPTAVPEHCVISLDRRWIPGESGKGVIEELNQILEKLKQNDAQVHAYIEQLPSTAQSPHDAFENSSDSYIVQSLIESYENIVEKKTNIIGVNYWTDAAMLHNYGNVECVVCGPGNIVQAHSSDEYIEIEQLLLATKVYFEAACQICK